MPYISHDSRSWPRLIKPQSVKSDATVHLDNCGVPWKVFVKTVSPLGQLRCSMEGFRENDNKHLELLSHLSHPNLMTEIPVIGSSLATLSVRYSFNHLVT